VTAFLFGTFNVSKTFFSNAVIKLDREEEYFFFIFVKVVFLHLIGTKKTKKASP
jgi:hypothetical protein